MMVDVVSMMMFPWNEQAIVLVLLNLNWHDATMAMLDQKDISLNDSMPLMWEKTDCSTIDRQTMFYFKNLNFICSSTDR
jgi:hypothetical protein